MLKFTDRGIYCVPGDFYVDPWKPVDRAVITHAHSDHARWGMKRYLTHHHSIPVMRHRLGEDIQVQGMEFGESQNINGVRVSLHPAGHIIGSAQVRMEHRGEVWVASGDYKVAPDGFSEEFEPVACHHFITESTFGLPVYKWKPQEEVIKEINDWWRSNAEKGVTSVLVAYALGKAQRVINNVDHSIGRIFTHGAVENTNVVLRSAGLEVLPTTLVEKETSKEEVKGSLVIATPSALGTSWMNRFKPFQTAMASGWMMLRGPRRRRNVDRGFVLSDHADWSELNTAIKATGAENIYVTHGYSTIYSKYLREQGYNASVVETEYEGETDSGESVDA